MEIQLGGMTMKNKGIRLGWLAAALVLLGAEVLIGLYVRDDFIRPYGGDILVVILLGCLLRGAFPRLGLWLSPAVFTFAVAVEISQHFHLVDRIGLGHIPFFSILMGNSFAWGDIWSYGVGCVIFLLADWLFRPGVVSLRTKGIHLAYGLVCTVLANLYLPLMVAPWLLAVMIPGLLFVLIFAGGRVPKTTRRRMKICYHGATLLLAFQISGLISLLYHLWLAAVTLPADPWSVIWSCVLCIVIEAVIFWVGIICVYCTSVQLGLKMRVYGLLCGMILPLNLIALNVIIHVVREEVRLECEKEAVNLARRDQKVCATRYPIMMVHGIFFRDSAVLNYWGRIPDELEKNGATVRYGNHHSAASIEDCALELTRRIRAIREETGCDKVNIIAHSKGGLDCRYAISELGAGEYIASLTTINTPHRGCLFAECLLNKIPSKIQTKVADTYNDTLRKLGDTNPDFLTAVGQLTFSHCTELNKRLKSPPEEIYCQSIGSVMARPRGGRFPLNFSHRIVTYYDGENDGLVGCNSFAWGQKYTLLRPKGKKGISHGDMVDINRRNLPDFDVREFYVQLVSDLKQRGL